MHSVLKEDFERMRPYVPDKERLRGSRWLITGATGVVGSYLLSFLAWLNEADLDSSMRFTVLHRSELRTDHLTVGHLIGKDYIEFVRTDLSSAFGLPERERYDIIYHGASNAAPRSYLADPIGTINTNVRGTQILLDHAVSERPDVFLYVSSGEIYGSPDGNHVPTPESYIGITDHLSPRSCYVEAKKFGETLCANYFAVHSVPIKMIRPVHVFGPGFRKNDSRVWVDFIVKACSGHNIEILSDGLARRGFCYLSDAVTQMLAVILRGKSGEVYNIGNDDHVSIRDLARIVSEASRERVEVIIRNQPPGYLKGSPEISCPSIEKVRSLALLLSTTVREGIARSMEWCYTVHREPGA